MSTDVALGTLQGHERPGSANTTTTTTTLSSTSDSVSNTSSSTGTPSRKPSSGYHPATATTTPPTSGKTTLFPKERSRSLGGHNPGFHNINPLRIPRSPPPFAPTMAATTAASSARSISLSPQATSRLAYHHGKNLPFLNNLSLSKDCGPPPTTRTSPTEVRKAMEAAVQAERTRAKEMEQQEVNMTADELRQVLKRERNRMSKIAADFAKLKTSSVQYQAEAEIHEEGRINGLMRRLENLQYEKGRIILELEREEEMLTNTLQKKLNQVRKEKAQLEELIAREQLNHSEMKTKLTDLREGSTTTPEGTTTSQPIESQCNNPVNNKVVSRQPLRMNSVTEGDEDEEEEGDEEAKDEKNEN